RMDFMATTLLNTPSILLSALSMPSRQKWRLQEFFLMLRTTTSVIPQAIFLSLSMDLGRDGTAVQSDASMSNAARTALILLKNFRWQIFPSSLHSRSERT